MSLGEFCPWTFSIIFSLFIDRFIKIRSQNDHQNTHFLLYSKLKIENLKCVCLHTQYVQKLGVIGCARTHINLGQITIKNQIYSEARKAPLCHVICKRNLIPISQLRCHIYIQTYILT